MIGGKIYEPVRQKPTKKDDKKTNKKKGDGLRRAQGRENIKKGREFPFRKKEI